MNADKKQIWMDGQLIEVTEAVYEAYMKGDRKIRYFERDLKTERFILDEDGHVRQVIPSREDSLDRLSEDNAEQFPDERESVEELVLRRLRHEQLRKALDILTEKERALILALFFEEKTEREIGGPSCSLLNGGLKVFQKEPQSHCCDSNLILRVDANFR